MTDQEYDPFPGLKKGDKVLVAFSGGVDSSVAAYLCQQAELNVLAVTMLLFGDQELLRMKAQSAAGKLGIPLDFLDLSEVFEEKVIRRTWEIYRSGKTPNPCAVCNPVFKFGYLMEHAMKNGCAALVTGHYARRIQTANGPVLQKGLCGAKDQSYFLFGVSKEHLEKTCFPLGAMMKDQVRQIASKLGLPNADAPDSQDVCFAPKDGSSLGEALRLRFGEAARPGNFRSMDGRILGTHRGIHAYTIGQRKGTGVALGVPAYVKELQKETNDIIITADEKALCSRIVEVEECVFADESLLQKGSFACDAKVRYRTPASRATAQIEGNRVKLIFETAQRAVTPGQAAVFYMEDRVVGGGWIEKTYLMEKENVSC